MMESEVENFAHVADSMSLCMNVFDFPSYLSHIVMYFSQISLRGR